MGQEVWLITACGVARSLFKQQHAGRLEKELAFLQSQFTQGEVVTPSDLIGT
jgi:hypothetical protein